MAVVNHQVGKQGRINKCAMTGCEEIEVDIKAHSYSNICVFLFSTVGNHGYDNTLRSMQPVFVARGPAFRQKYVKTSMRSVDLYPLMCHILSTRPLPNNGSLLNVQDLLSEAPPPSTTAPPHPPIPPKVNGYSYAPVVGSFLGVVLVLGFLVVYIILVTLKQRPALKRRSWEMSQPLLQEDLHL